MNIRSKLLIFSLLLLLLSNRSVVQGWESDIHPISSKTPAPQYQPIDRKKRNGKILDEYSRDRAASANKKELTLLLKPVSLTLTNTGLARSFQRDSGRGINVQLYCEVLHRGGAVSMCDQSTVSNPHWHIRSR